MASQGKQKFEKYFRGFEQVTTFAKSVAGKPIPVFKDLIGNDKVDVLKDGEPITVLVGKEYTSRYHVTYQRRKDGWVDDQNVLGYIHDCNTGKPLRKNGIQELNRMTALDFVKGAPETTFKFAGSEIKCLEFSNPRSISDVIQSNLSYLRFVTGCVEKTFETYFRSGKVDFEWKGGVSPEERKKYGCYLGEVLVGYLGMMGKKFTNTTPWDNVGRFLLPTDPSFSGVDGFVETEEGKIIPISNKFGDGAAASFFTNILPLGMKRKDNLKPSTFLDLVKAAERSGTSPDTLERKRGSRTVLYQYGLDTILGLKDVGVQRVYEDIKYNRPTEEKNLLMESIRKATDDDRILQALPHSATAFFSRTIADRLNEESKDDILDILCGKNYYQFNLDIPRWMKGGVYYRVTNSGASTINFIGNKSAINDIDGKQGMVNYRLKTRT